MSNWGFAANQYTLTGLERYILSGHVPHALLFCGEEGTGKGFLAERFAMALCCIAPVSNRPCLVCSHCHKILTHIHPDISIWGGTKGARSFHVEEIRNLIGELYIKPNEAACKVFILKNCENLTPGAANALLKALEEPPQNTYFILTARSRSDLMPTILSRVTTYTLLNSQPQQAEAYIQKAAGCDIAVATQASALFDGNIGQAIDYITNESFQKDITLCQQIQNALTQNTSAPLSLALLPLEKLDRATAAALLDMLYRRICQNLRDEIDHPNKNFSANEFVSMLQIVSDTADRLRKNASIAPTISLLAARLRSV